MFSSRSGILPEAICIASTSLQQKQSISLVFAMSTFEPLEICYSNMYVINRQLKRKYT